MLLVISMIFFAAAFILSVVIAFTPVEHTYSLAGMKRCLRTVLIFGVIIAGPAIYFLAKSEVVTTSSESTYLDAAEIVFKASQDQTEILLKTELDSYIPQARYPMDAVKFIPMPDGDVKVVTNSSKRTCGNFTLDALTGLEFVNMKYTQQSYVIYYPTGIKIEFP